MMNDVIDGSPHVKCLVDISCHGLIKYLDARAESTIQHVQICLFVGIHKVPLIYSSVHNRRIVFEYLHAAFVPSTTTRLRKRHSNCFA